MIDGDLYLKDFKPRSALINEVHIPTRARFPVIDGHNHLGKLGEEIANSLGQPFLDPAEMVDLMDEMHVECVVNLDGGWGDELKINLDKYKAAFPNRFCIFCSVDWSEIDRPDFGEKWSGFLRDAVNAGVQGLKVFKSLGLVYRDVKGKLIDPADPRLFPIWETAGELNIPVLIHSADPIAFFWPLDEFNERWDELHAHPDWHFYGKDYPSFDTLIASQLKILGKHPNTRFISAHLLSNSENLKFVAQALDTFPNLSVDIGERIGEIGRQPYSSRQFIIDYQDRVIFGTDIPPHKPTYQTYFRCLETMDEYFDYGRQQGRYCIYGIHLPDEVLSKIYYKNAAKIIPGILSN